MSEAEKRWTATVTFKITDDRNGYKYYQVEEMGDLDAILDDAGLNWFCIVGINFVYNIHKGMAISLAQLLVENDLETVGMLQ